MKKNLIIVAIAAIAMTGCQDNELFDVPKGGSNDGTIKFGIIAPQTRANTLYTGTSSLLQDGNTFNVWGIIAKNGSVYLGNNNVANSKVVTYSGATGEWSYDSPKFWPDDKMHFLAYHSENKTKPDKLDTTNIAMTWTSFTVDTEVKKHDDLLVAGLADAAKPSLNGSTVLTFKHAMTQVVFSAQLYTGSKLIVKIDDVEIYNVASSGDLTVSASGSASDPNDPKDRKDGDAVIDWKPSVTKDSSFKVTSMGGENNGSLILNGTTQNYTYPVTSLTNYEKGAMMMIPQTFDAWNAQNNINANLYKDGKLDPAQAGGAFIRVKCQIKDGETGIDLWGNDTTSKDIFIPVSSTEDQISEWVWGKKINYVITFGDPGSGSGGGGWDGGNEEPDKPNNPILVPIKLDAVLTDWDEYEAYLQTVNFSKDAYTLNYEAIKGITDQLMDEVKNNPAKIYTASIKVTSSNDASRFNIENILKTFLGEEKFKAGSIITFDFGTNNNSNVMMNTAGTTKDTIQFETGKGLYFIQNANGTWTVTKYDDVFGDDTFLSNVTGSNSKTFSAATHQEKFSFAGAQYYNNITFSNWPGNGSYDKNVNNNLTTWDLALLLGDNSLDKIDDYIILDFTKMKFLNNPTDNSAPTAGITIRVNDNFGIGASVEEAKNSGPITRSAALSGPTYTIVKPGYVYIVRKDRPTSPVV